MAKKVHTQIKLQIPAGKANPSPPVGPALGQHGVNIMEFCKQFNVKTQKDGEMVIPVIITVYTDRSFTFETKTPPASILLKKVCGLKVTKKPGAGSKEPNKIKIGTVNQKQIEEVAKIKMQDLTAKDLPGAMRIIAGTAKSMGLEVVD